MSDKLYRHAVDVRISRHPTERPCFQAMRSGEVATLQLRGSSYIAYWDYVSRDTLSDVIRALTEIRDALPETVESN